MSREDVAMDVTIENVELLRKEVQAAKLLLGECDEIFSEEGISNIELRGYLSGKLSADEVIELIASQQGERHSCKNCLGVDPDTCMLKHPEHPEGFTHFPALLESVQQIDLMLKAEGAQGELSEALDAAYTEFRHEMASGLLEGESPSHWKSAYRHADDLISRLSFDAGAKAVLARAALAQPSPAPELNSGVFGILPEFSSDKRVCAPTNQKPFCWLAAGQHFNTKAEALAASKLAPGHTPSIRPLYTAPVTHAGQVPNVLFDGFAVYQALSDKAKGRTSSHNVSDTLDAVVKLMRAAAPQPAEGE